MKEITLPMQGKLVAFFHQSADLYGSDRVLLDLVRGVKEAGGSPVVLLPSLGPLTEAFVNLGIEFHVLPVVKLTRARFSLKGLVTLFREAFWSLKRIDQIFLGRQVHLVHSNTIAVLAGAIWAKRRKVPHLWHVHEIIVHPSIAARGFPRMVKALADHVICNSNATYTWLANECPGLRPKMSVIWNGVKAPAAIDATTVQLFRDKFHPAATRLAVGLLGRINRLKGHHLLLDAAEYLHQQGVRDFSIVFIGSPPPGQDIYLEQLQQRIAISPMRDRIVLQDFANDVWPIYAALDIVCVPSTEPESFGLVAAEAMASGKPVVASQIGGLAEVVLDGITGRLFRPGDPVALSEALSSLLKNDSARIKLGRDSLERIAIEFGTEHMVKKFVCCSCNALRE